VKRINAVMNYIEKNLDGDIDDNIISSLYASPHGMFQRTFANITDMRLSEYIRKRRLTRAAVDIKNTDEKIIDVAMKYGYNSAVAFSSAFKKFHGITPSAMKKSGARPKYFQPFAFTLSLSEKGAGSMQYYNMESAEYFLRQIVNEKNEKIYFRSISEHNGVKSACDGYRVMVMLPEGVADWDLSDAYFDTGDKEKSRFELQNVFNQKDDSGLRFNLTKEQAALLLISFDGAKADYNRKYLSLSTAEKGGRHDAIVCIDMNNMGFVAEQTALTRKGQAGPIMAFNVRYIEEAVKFIMCSDDSCIEIYYSGNLSPLIIKSGRLYAVVLPLKLKDDAA